MTAELSIVIATRNAEALLPATVEPLMEGLRAGLIRDLVIADGGSTDATRRIADAVGADVVEGPPDRDALVRLGVAQAKGAWVLALAPGTRLGEGWADLVADHMRGRGGAACFRLVPRGGGMAVRLACLRANLRTRLTGGVTARQGLLAPRRDWGAGRVRVLDVVLYTAGLSDAL